MRCRCPSRSKAAPLPFLRSLRRLYALVRRHRVRLIHCNEQNVYPIGSYLGRLCGLPVVVSVHFTMDRGFCRWAFGGARRPRRIYFVSRGNLEACRDSIEGVIPEADREVLENGLDLERFRPDAERRDRFRRMHGLPADATVLGVACALRPRKQLEHLIEAVARLDRPGLHCGGRRRAGPGRRSLRRRPDRRGKATAGRPAPVPGASGRAARLLLRPRPLREYQPGRGVQHQRHRGAGLRRPGRRLSEQVGRRPGPAGRRRDRAAGPRRPAGEALDRWISEPGRLAIGREGARRRAEEAFDIRKLADRLWDEYRAIVDRPEPAGRIGGASR